MASEYVGLNPLVPPSELQGKVNQMLASNRSYRAMPLETGNLLRYDIFPIII